MPKSLSFRNPPVERLDFFFGAFKQIPNLVPLCKEQRNWTHVQTKGSINKPDQSVRGNLAVEDVFHSTTSMANDSDTNWNNMIRSEDRSVRDYQTLTWIVKAHPIFKNGHPFCNKPSNSLLMATGLLMKQITRSGLWQKQFTTQKCKTCEDTVILDISLRCC